VWLVHCSLQPNLGQRFFAYDDHGLVDNGTAAPFAPDMKCVVMAPGVCSSPLCQVHANSV
jgi:hypothetical protein